MKQLLPYLLLVFATFAPSHAADVATDLTAARTLPLLPVGAFTVVVIPDTQRYLGRDCKLSEHSTGPVTNANLEAQIEWICEHVEDQNIVFVTHVGDIVDKNRPEEWAVAKKHLDQLRGVVPFSLTVGNHDMSKDGDARLFQGAFSAASFASYPWYLASYGHSRPDQSVSTNNVNSAQLFTAAGWDFIHLSLECNAPDDVLDWANGLLTQHVARRALITTHMDLGIVDQPTENAGYIHDPKGRMNWVKIHGERGNSGAAMWDKIYRKHPNIAMIFCGDQSRVTALRVDAQADDGHLIPSLLSDYGSATSLRLMRFCPDANQVSVLTHDVVAECLVEKTDHVKEPSAHQFTVDYSMKP